MLNFTNLKLVAIFIFLFGFPALALTYVNLSRSICILFISFVLFLFSFRVYDKVNFSKSELIKAILIFLYLLYGCFILLIFNSEYKPTLSFIVLILTFFIILIYCKSFSNIRIENLSKSLFYTYVFFSSFAWVYIVFKEYLPDYGHEKYVFPFTEHSHYALTSCYIGMISAYFLSKNHKIFVIATIIAQGVIFPNLTMIVFGFLALMILVLKGKKISIFIGLAFMLAIYQALPLILNEDQFAYFTDRLTLDLDTYNLTTLVYLQGLDDAYRSLKDSYGLGLGFQMAGTNEIGRFGESIRYYNGKDFNREDAGFLAAKIVIELGVVGILFLILYIKSLISFIFRNKNENPYKDLPILCLSCLFVEIFFRGYGYFSSQILFLLIVYFYAYYNFEREI